MILHSACVENYKGIRGPLEVTFDPDLPNLLEGPNGTGKSTLVEAIQCALTENHTTTGAGAEQMRPRETTLTPSMSVVFEHGGTVYRVSKTFLDSPKALLERRRPDASFEAIARGRAADEQVREMLRSHGTRAKDKPGERLGLFSILCSSQNQQDLPALSGIALTDIREMLGAQISGKHGDAFEKAVNKRHLSLWTPGGKPKKGRLTEVQEQLAKVRLELEQSREVIRRVATHEAAAVEHRAQSQTTLDQLQTGQGEAAALAPVAQQVIDLRARRVPAVSRKDAAHANYKLLRTQIDQIAEATKKKRSCEDAGPQLEEAEKKARRELETRVHEAAAARQGWQGSSKPDPELEVAEARVERAGAFLSLVKEIPALQSRLRRDSEASERKIALDHQLTALNAPDGSRWAEIQSVGYAFEEAKLKVEALELRVEVSAERDLAVDIIAGDPAGEIQVAEGHSLTARGDGQVEIRLLGIAILTVSGPAGHATEWRARLEERRASLEALLAPFGVPTWQELVGRVQQRENLSAELRAADADHRAALGDETVAELSERAQKLEIQHGEILAAEPLWATQTPDLPDLKDQISGRKTERIRAQTQAMAKWQAAEGRRAEAERTAAFAGAAREANEKSHAAAAAELATLESDGRSMVERQDDLSNRRRELESAEENLQKIGAELAALPAEAPDRLTAIHGRISQLETEIQQAREAYKEDEAAARALLHQGPYTSLAIAEERVKQLEDDEAAETHRLAATWRLKTAVDEAKAKALAGISEPVEQRAAAILERIVGRPFVQIQLGGGLESKSVRPEGCDGPAPVADMSAGEREQIYFAARLALAEVLSGGERQVLVLDDPLVNTDPERLPRVLELIKEKSARLQFSVLPSGALPRAPGRCGAAPGETGLCGGRRMNRTVDGYLYAPSDLVNFILSEFITWMDRYAWERPSEIEPVGSEISSSRIFNKFHSSLRSVNC
jgi:DNA repair exonuclease SbcCD ATPase subunit